MKDEETKANFEVDIEPILREIRNLGIELEDWMPEAYAMTNRWMLSNETKPLPLSNVREINHRIIGKMRESENPLCGNSYLKGVECILGHKGLELPLAEIEQESKEFVDQLREELGWGKAKYQMDIGSLFTPTETETSTDGKQ